MTAPPTKTGYLVLLGVAAAVSLPYVYEVLT